jgi:hypothetical protein
LQPFWGSHCDQNPDSFLLVVFWMRLGWSLANLSKQNSIETIHAYRMFPQTLPRLLRDLGK